MDYDSVRLAHAILLHIPASPQSAFSLQTNFKRYQEGERVKFSLDGNTAKYYDKAYSEWGSVLRVGQTTINRVDPFKEYRARKSDPEGRVGWRPLRKGIAGLFR